MATNNYAKIEFIGRSSNEAFARSAAACFVSQLDPTLEELGDIKTAVSEAVTNCIVHAYPTEIGKILLKCRIVGTDTVELSVRDWGCGIDDVDRAMEPLFTTGGEDRSGMGFSIMECFMDSLRVKSAPGRGTTVTMRKKISKKHGR